MIILVSLKMPFGFPQWFRGKESAFNAGITGNKGLTPGLEDPLEEGMATHSSILAGKPHGHRSLVDCSL